MSNVIPLQRSLKVEKLLRQIVAELTEQYGVGVADFGHPADRKIYQDCGDQVLATMLYSHAHLVEIAGKRWVLSVGEKSDDSCPCFFENWDLVAISFDGEPKDLMEYFDESVPKIDPKENVLLIGFTTGVLGFECESRFEATLRTLAGKDIFIRKPLPFDSMVIVGQSTVYSQATYKPEAVGIIAEVIAQALATSG